jgi:hypothetical protein
MADEFSLRWSDPAAQQSNSADPTPLKFMGGPQNEPPEGLTWEDLQSLDQFNQALVQTARALNQLAVAFSGH